MTSPRLDSKGRIVVPKEDRDVWHIEPDDAVHLRVTGPNGRTRSVRDTIDSRGRIVVPKDKRDDLNATEGDTLDVTVLGVEEGDYICEDCGDQYDLGKVLVLNNGDRIVCAACSTPEDRVIS